NGLGFKNIYEIAIDENDVLWLGHGAPFPDGNSTAALTIFDGEDQWLVLTKDNSPLEENSCYAITFGLDGDKWLGQKNKGIFRLNDNGTPFDPSDDIWTHYTKSDGMGENTFNSNSADTNINGEVWFGHSRNDSGIWDPGCSRFDGTIWTNYQFGETRIRSITHDAQGNVWLGDKGGEESTGLWKFDGQNWENWNTLNSDLPIDYINDVVIDNQNGLIWIGTFNPDNGDAKGGVVKVEGLIIPVSVELKQSSVPSEFYLAQNYPNPFNPVTTINYDIPQGMGVHVKIEIFNLRGQPVSILVDKTQQAGHYSARWDGKDFDGRKAPSGIYWYQLTAGQHTLTRKMVLVY
ncbi:MAG TPA: T9SS type A sorting domain-containing protein, partial [bacterium]